MIPNPPIDNRFKNAWFGSYLNNQNRGQPNYMQGLFGNGYNTYPSPNLNPLTNLIQSHLPNAGTNTGTSAGQSKFSGLAGGIDSVLNALFSLGRGR